MKSGNRNERTGMNTVYTDSREEAQAAYRKHGSKSNLVWKPESGNRGQMGRSMSARTRDDRWAEIAAEQNEKRCVKCAELLPRHTSTCPLAMA